MLPTICVQCMCMLYLYPIRYTHEMNTFRWLNNLCDNRKFTYVFNIQCMYVGRYSDISRLSSIIGSLQNDRNNLNLRSLKRLNASSACDYNYPYSKELISFAKYLYGYEVAGA